MILPVSQSVVIVLLVWQEEKLTFPPPFSPPVYASLCLWQPHSSGGDGSEMPGFSSRSCFCSFICKMCSRTLSAPWLASSVEHGPHLEPTPRSSECADPTDRVVFREHSDAGFQFS